jgi:hypothetical protein
MISDDDWNSLAAAAAGRRSPGAARRRLHPDSRHDLYIALSWPGEQRATWYEFPADALPDDTRIPTLRSVAVTVGPAGGDLRRCEIRLENPDLADVFTRLVEDVSSAVAAASGDAAGVRALLDRLERWRRLLEPGPDAGLTLAERRGLFGELHVLGQLLDGGIPPTTALSAWTGPLNRHQDFQFTHTAIEVKTTSAKQPQSVVITSERELDPTGIDHLYLVHISLDERRGGQGVTLPELAADLSSRLQDDAQATSLLEQRLLAAGLLAEHLHLYGEPHYSIRSSHAFRVADGFPCITETGLPEGVGDVRYRIQTGALTLFRRPWEDVLSTSGDAT